MMREVKSSEKTLNGVTIETWITEIISANMLEVEVGTNGYQGGDSGHGCRTYFKLKDLASTDIEPKINRDENGNLEVEIALGGDCELNTFIESLEFAIKVLKECSK
jgi:hypothetical protein